MMILKMTELKEGMQFSKPVYIDDTNLLVAEQVPLKQKEIDRCLRWGVSQVHTEGELISRQVVVGAAGTVLNYLKTPAQQEIFKSYTKLLERFRKIQEAIRSQGPVESSEIDKIVDAIMTMVAKSKDDLVQFLLFGNQAESDSSQNAVNSMIYSILLASNLSFIQHKLLQLATGSLLHDTGMLRLPDSITRKQGKLEPEEMQKLRMHPILSYKIITKELRYSEEIGLIAAQHHERWDGEGYPKKVAGTKISLSARIVTVADAFEAMISKRPYRDSMIGYIAMKTLLGDNGRRFDPDVLKTFIKCMGIYPIGSIILLNNACIGRVVGNNPEAPLRPRIKIMIDKNGNIVEDGEYIDLNEEKNKQIFIAKAVDQKSLPKNGKE
jgi:HD-GYP domain-containing protein (c-di-GMP phosphodiesterase class II)